MGSPQRGSQTTRCPPPLGEGDRCACAMVVGFEAVRPNAFQISFRCLNQVPQLGVSAGADNPLPALCAGPFPPLGGHCLLSYLYVTALGNVPPRQQVPNAPGHWASWAGSPMGEPERSYERGIGSIFTTLAGLPPGRPLLRSVKKSDLAVSGAVLHFKIQT